MTADDPGPTTPTRRLAFRIGLSEFTGHESFEEGPAKLSRMNSETDKNITFIKISKLCKLTFGDLWT